jgi:hypothetical protein
MQDRENLPAKNELQILLKDGNLHYKDDIYTIQVNVRETIHTFRYKFTNHLLKALIFLFFSDPSAERSKYNIQSYLHLFSIIDDFFTCNSISEVTTESFQKLIASFSAKKSASDDRPRYSELVRIQLLSRFRVFYRFGIQKGFLNWDIDKLEEIAPKVRKDVWKFCAFSETYKALDGELKIEQDTYLLTLQNNNIPTRGETESEPEEKASSKKEQNTYVNFSQHPLREVIKPYLLINIENVSLTALSHTCTTLNHIEKILVPLGRPFDAATVTYLIQEWLSQATDDEGKPRFTKNVRNQIRLLLLSLLKFGAETGLVGLTKEDWEQFQKLNPPPAEGKSFVALETHVLRSGEMAANGLHYKVSCYNKSRKEQRKHSYFDLTQHIFSDFIPALIQADVIERKEEVSATHAYHLLWTLKILFEFLHSTEHDNLTASTIRQFIRWIMGAKKSNGQERFTPSTLQTLALYTIIIYRLGARIEYRAWTLKKLETIEYCVDRMLRGNKHRASQLIADRAPSHPTLQKLNQAVVLEFEECRRVFQDYEAGRRPSLFNLDQINTQVLDPDPFVVLMLLLGLGSGARPGELNELTTDDLLLDESNGEATIRLHSPTRPTSYAPVPAMVVEAWRYAQAWDQEARGLVPQLPVKCAKALFVIPVGHAAHKQFVLRPFHTSTILDSRLPVFLRKYFHYQVINERGEEVPFLHFEGDPTRPLMLNTTQLRKAFARTKEDFGRDTRKTQEALGHNQALTSSCNYLPSAEHDRAKRIHQGLRAYSLGVAQFLTSPEKLGIPVEEINELRSKADALAASQEQQREALPPGSEELFRREQCVLASRVTRLQADAEAWEARSQALASAGQPELSQQAAAAAERCRQLIQQIESGKEEKRNKNGER